MPIPLSQLNLLHIIARFFWGGELAYWINSAGKTRVKLGELIYQNKLKSKNASPSQNAAV
jgi:hypothetical protein